MLAGQETLIRHIKEFDILTDAQARAMGVTNDQDHQVRFALLKLLCFWRHRSP